MRVMWLRGGIQGDVRSQGEIAGCCGINGGAVANESSRVTGEGQEQR